MTDARSRRAPVRRRRHHGDERGLTLIEVMIATTLLLLVFVPVSQLLVNVLSQASNSRERLTALSLAEQYIETLDQNGPPTSATHLPTVTTTILETKTAVVRSSVSYTVYARFHWLAQNSETCTLATSPKLLRLQVTVDWGPSARYHVRDRTIIDYPAPNEVTKGYLLIQLVGSTTVDGQNRTFGTRASLVPITIDFTKKATGATTTRKTKVYAKSTATGCVFEPETAGTYKISVGQPTGTQPVSWVANANESTTAKSSTVNVVAGLVTKASFQWDEGTYVALAYPATTATDGAVTCPNKGAIECIAFGQSPKTTSVPNKSGQADVYLLKASGWTTTYHPKATTAAVNYPMTRAGGAACTSVAVSFTNRCLVVGTAVEKNTVYDGVVSTSSTVTASTGFTTATNVGSTTASLTQVVCSSSAITLLTILTDRCFATGWTSSRAAEIVTASIGSSGAVSLAIPTLPQPATGVTGYTATSVLSLSCTSSGPCYALVEYLKVSTVKYAVLSTTPSSLTAPAWTLDTFPTTTPPKTFSTLGCAAALTALSKPVCYVVGTAGASNAITDYSISAASNTAWTKDTLPASPFVAKSITAVICPTATKCYEVGSATTSGTKGVVLSSPGTSTWTKQTVSTTTITLVTKVTCLNATKCYAFGTTSSAPVILSLATTTWSKDTISGTTLSGLVAMACATPSCFAIGMATGTTGGPVLLKLPASGSTTLTLITTPSAEHLSAVGCATKTHCTVIGASATTAVFADGKATASSWASAPPSSLTGTGMYVEGVPIAVSAATLLTSSPLEIAESTTTDITSIGPLFPFTSGYSVAATSCPQEMTTAGTSATAKPGTTATTAATTPVTLPMSILPIQVKGSHGQPDSGATVTATLITGSSLCTTHTVTTGTYIAITKLSGIANPGSYTLAPTDALGQSAIDLMYGYYKLTVKYNSHTPATPIYVEVSPTNTVTSTSTAFTTTTTVLLPNPVVVTIT